MGLLAAGFATTPSGYLTPSLIALLGGLLLYLLQRSDNRRRDDNRINTARQDDQEAALTALTRATDLLVAQLAPLQATVLKEQDKRVALSEAVAVLNSTLDRHVKWAEKQHDLIVSRIGAL